MRKFLLILAVLCGTVSGWAEVDSSIKGKGVAGVGDAVTTLNTDTWYLLYNHGRNCYVSEETTSVKMRATNNFASFPFKADTKAGYMFKLESAGTEGHYYIKSGNGLYFTINQGSSNISETPVAYTIGQIEENSNHFYGVMDSDGRVFDGNAAGGTLAGWGTTIPTTPGGNSCYHFLPIELVDATTWTTYQNGLAAAATLPYAIQQAYGVNEATKYTSNAQESQEGSYEALIDNVYNDPSHFHSSYSKAIGDYHYLQIEVSEGVTDFYFYFKKRQGNNNNRPTEIEIQGSADGKDFATIKTINEGFPTDGGVIDYMSDKVSASANIKYIRFVVKKTNNDAKDAENGHPFFTFSEFYVLPSNFDVANLITSYKAFLSSDIKSQDMVSAAEALINAEKLLALSNIKKQVASILAANNEKHATEPVLGQYTTETYNALDAAYKASDATEESLNEAIATFKASLNRPVYFITSLHDGYAAGSAILYNGSSWKWAPADIYNKQMWMAIPGYTQENVPVVEAYNENGTSYEICDYLTGTLMRGKKVQIVKIANWDGAYNLQYNADATSTDAAQHAKDTKDLVNWKPATTTDSKASAWHIEYIGNSFDLDKLTDEKMAALASMKAAYGAKVYCKNAVLGNGLGQYQGDKEAIVAALTKAEGISEKSLVELANMTIEDINAITNEINATAGLVINQPISGKFYRIKGGIHTSLPNHYITGNTNSDGGRIALKEDEDGTDASTVYYYADGKLLAYGSGLYFGLSSSHYVFATVDGTKPASEITFAASLREAGAYTIKSADRYVHYKVYNGEAEIDRCAEDVHAEHDWFLEEVTSLPFTFKRAALGFATFNAPVAVELPEGISAYIGELNTENNTLQMYRLDGNQIPANTAVLLRKEGVTEDATVDFTIVSNAEEDFGSVKNNLVGTVAAEKLDGTKNCYSLQKSNAEEKVGFYSKTTGTKGGFKAWLETEKAVGARAFTIIFDGEDATGIKEALGLENENVEIYDLSGRRLDKPAKGVNIIGGKTVIVR